MKVGLQNNVLADLRQTLDLSANDDSRDAEILSWSAETQWEQYLCWNGIIGMGMRLDDAHRAIFGLGESVND